MEENDHFTKSIDTFKIEVNEYNGREYVEIKDSSDKHLLFPKGDEGPAFRFLSDIARLLGVKIPFKEKKK